MLFVARNTALHRRVMRRACIQIGTSGAHAMAVVLDANAFTGFANACANSETVTITVLPSSNIETGVGV